MSLSWTLGPPTESPFFRFLRSQFQASPQWPSKETNLAGKIALMTGASSGLGLEASRQLLSLGLSRLIIAVRSTDKGERVAAEFRTQFPEADIQVWHLEMESYRSVQDFALRIDREMNRLDIAILNAGVQALHFETVSETRHEKLLQVNYLSTMLLAILLLPVLKTKSPPDAPGRLTIVSSGTARGAEITWSLAGAGILSHLDDSRHSWNPVTRYAVTKLLGHLFVLDLARRVEARDVVVNLVDPGLVKDTNLQGGASAPLPIAAFFYGMKTLLGRSLPVGASTYIDAVISKGVESHGSYVADWNIAAFAAFVYTPNGEAARKQLWTETMLEFDAWGAHEILKGVKDTVTGTSAMVS
ncbi:hypothetical protein PFICI_11918 [Pestalotiopsis fici W106-1]|uniref:Uncharacterized protein n=1 Tax=Pestalotiopsis fici (strain W106-1 / CGMCC3.15140) TaxID=1229662 RepID=W3WUI7_PESFW|nr:uncharacterized protein PFICI_11918 [Pestalotiopsis fici W106-1]ETS76531.1 hypothetical protein PFICI_11918 [Pestalotiopsis fici W106-1]